MKSLPRQFFHDPRLVRSTSWAVAQCMSRTGPVRNSTRFFRQPARTRNDDTDTCLNTVFFDKVHVVSPLVYTIAVLPQPDVLLIGLCVALRHGLAVMKRSQVTPVTLVLDTINSAILAHGVCAGLELGVTHKRRVQHKLPEFVSGL